MLHSIFSLILLIFLDFVYLCEREIEGAEAGGAGEGEACSPLGQAPPQDPRTPTCATGGRSADGAAQSPFALLQDEGLLQARVALFRVCARLCVFMRSHAEGPCVCGHLCVCGCVCSRTGVFPERPPGRSEASRTWGVWTSVSRSFPLPSCPFAF